MQRILIIGLDGASPHLINRWRDGLPNLSKLMTQGASGVLQSITPPRSVPAWYCFATGMNPAKIGVFGFSQRLPGTYDYTFANFNYCRMPPFWDQLNRYGIETGVLHVPGTYPPRPLAGFTVSGWPAPTNSGNLVYTSPKSLSRDIDEYLSRPFEFLSSLSIQKNNDAEALNDRLRILAMHGDIADTLLREKPWQVALVVLSPLDRASHQYWRHIDSEHPQYTEELNAVFGESLKEMYKACDSQVGRLLENLDDEDWVFIVSDHGFGPNHRIFYINEWLKQQGYLHIKTEQTKLGADRRTSLIGRLASPLFKFNKTSPTFRRLTAPFKKQALSNFLRNEYVRTKENGLVRLNHLPVDWTRTRVYCPDESSIYLNLQGRDPQGIVQSGVEAEQLATELEERLRTIPDPVTGQPIPVHIVRKEDVYTGPYLEDAPDLIMAMDHYRTEVMAELGHGQLFDLNPDRNGTHTPEGLLIAKGPAIPPGVQFDAGLMDIAPTVLHIAGVSIPAETDGRVLIDLFEDGSEFRSQSVVYKSEELEQEDAESFTKEEQAQVEEQLRNLGYLA